MATQRLFELCAPLTNNALASERYKQSRLNVFWGPGPAELMGPLPPPFPSLPSSLPFSPLLSPTLFSPPLRRRPLKSS